MAFGERRFPGVLASVDRCVIWIRAPHVSRRAWGTVGAHHGLGKEAVGIPPAPARGALVRGFFLAAVAALWPFFSALELWAFPAAVRCEFWGGEPLVRTWPAPLKNRGESKQIKF